MMPFLSMEQRALILDFIQTIAEDRDIFGLDDKDIAGFDAAAASLLSHGSEQC